MSFRNRREIANQQQGGNSTVIGIPLEGLTDVEFHHTDGRTSSKGEALTLVEHMFRHFEQFYKNPKSDLGQQSFDVVMGRLGELGDDGKIELQDIIRKKLGIRVSFI